MNQNIEITINLYDTISSLLFTCFTTILIVLLIFQFLNFLLVILSPHIDTSGRLFLNIILTTIFYFAIKKSNFNLLTRDILLLVVVIITSIIYTYLKKIKYYS